MKTHDQFIDPVSEYYIYTPSATARQLFLFPTHIGLYHYLPGYSLNRSNYDSFLMMLILDGECDLNLSGEYFHAKKGALTLIDCYAPHQYESSCGWKALWLHFDGPVARNYYNYLSQKYGNLFVPADFHTIYQETTELFNIFQSGSKINEADISQRITGILNHLITPDSSGSSMPYMPVKEVISYISRHFSEPLTLEDLSERACLSPFYFTRIFARETGMTPHQYLISTRISVAKFMLKSTSFSIKEIGYQCGFSSVTSFCTTFKKWEHQTPGDYRNSV